MKTVLSLGAGVQSSTLALMAEHGEIEKPDAAIFADTGAEPNQVYTWLAWLDTKLSFPVYRVSAGDLTNDIGAKRLRGKFRKIPIPAFAVVNGKVTGMINRSCTYDYKIVPIRRKVRELLGIAGKRSGDQVLVRQLIGISLDEAHRMKDSGEPWVQNCYPLVERRITRDDCIKWMKSHGYPEPPKSSCVFCPFHSDRQWKNLDADGWDLAIRVDERLREAPPAEYRTTGTMFLHRSGRPLTEVRARLALPEAQLDLFKDGFGNECEGVCGV